MSRYILNDNTMVKISETFGTMENISDYRAQVYTGADVDEGIILYPRHRLSFNQELWVARMTGEVGTVVIAVLPYIEGNNNTGGNGGNGSGIGDGVNINVNNGCCCCDSCCGGGSVATVPSCDCGSDVTVVPTSSGCTCCPSVVIPESYCGGCGSSNGGLKLQFPIVINIPQTINVPSGCCDCNSDKTTSEAEDNKDTIDKFFDDPNAEDEDEGSHLPEIDGFWNNKD